MIQRITIWETNYAIHWIEIYPLDSTIHLLNKWGQIWKRVWKMTVFWSEIESGFLEPGGTPTTIIPMNTPPPPPGLRPRLVCRLRGSREASWWLRSYSDRGYGLVTYSQAVNSSCTNNAPDVEAHLPIQIRSHPFTFYSYFQAKRKTKTINKHLWVLSQENQLRVSDNSFRQNDILWVAWPVPSIWHT